jgi:hypothetical protein
MLACPFGFAKASQPISQTRRILRRHRTPSSQTFDKPTMQRLLAQHTPPLDAELRTS